MTHPIFRQEIFIETAFERRFEAVLRFAAHQRSWHVIVADPGTGKTMGIRDTKRTIGSPAMLAVTAPKNTEEELALGNQLFTALGLPLRGRWSERKPRLIGAMVQFGVKCLIVDDAQDLSLEHLMFLKELTDQGRLHYGYPMGLCLVTAGRGNTIPLKEIFDKPETMWLQFRRRLDKLEPFCRIESHTSEEVREILAALETVYRDPLPHLSLRQWAGSIYTWLTQPVLDPTNSGRVTMDYLMKLVTTALEWSHAAGATDVKAELLEQAAELLVLRRNTLRLIDGAGPSVDASPALSPTDVLTAEAEAAPIEVPDQAPIAPRTQATNRDAVEDSAQKAKPARCSFTEVLPIDVQAFQSSGIGLVECPACAATRTLAAHHGVLRFISHEQRKGRLPPTARRWARVEATWKVVGAEGA